MKMYQKSDLTLNHGLLVSKDGDIILPDYRIVAQANALEDMVQETSYLRTQPEATPMPSLDGYKRMSIDDSESRKFEVSTPIMDAKADEAMKLMEELDDVTTADKANSVIDHYKPLLDFVSQDFVIDCGNQLYKFDTPVLGNVLELTEADVIKAIAYVCGMTKEDDDKPTHGTVIIPATEENLNKVMEFFANFSDEDEAGDDTKSTDDTKVAEEETVDPLDDIRDFLSTKE